MKVSPSTALLSVCVALLGLIACQDESLEPGTDAMQAWGPDGAAVPAPTPEDAWDSATALDDAAITEDAEAEAVSEDPEPVDAGQVVDSGMPAAGDGGAGMASMDADVAKPDGGATGDAQAPTDAQADRDSGAVEAGGPPGDGEDGGPGAPPDAGEGVDAGAIDAGAIDAGEVDAGEVDAGNFVDAGELDAGEVDAGPGDDPFACAAVCAPSQFCQTGGCSELQALRLQTIGLDGDDRVRDALYGPEGALYVTGQVVGAVDFGAGADTAQSAAPIFVAAYETDGQLRWRRRFGIGTRMGWATAWHDGKLYVAAQTNAAVDINASTRLHVAHSKADSWFVARFDPSDGSSDWGAMVTDNTPACTQDGQCGDLTPLTMRVDDQGRVYIAGTLRGTMTLGTELYETQRDDADAHLTSAFMTRITPGVGVDWAHLWQSTQPGEARGLALFAGEEVWVGGTVGGDVDPASFGSGRTDGTAAAFVTRFTAGGSLETTFFEGGPSLLTALAEDPAGNGAFAVGTFSADLEQGACSTSASSPGEDSWLARLDGDASCAEVMPLGTANLQVHANDLALDEAGNAFVGGRVQGPVPAPDGTLLDTYGDWDAWVGSYQPNGDARWQFVMGGSTLDRFLAVAVAPDGRVAGVGTTKGAIGLPDDVATIPYGGGKHDALLVEVAQ